MFSALTLFSSIYILFYLGSAGYIEKKTQLKILISRGPSNAF